MVTHMSKLTIMQLKRPERLSPAEQRRAKLVSKLDEQLAMARAEIAGETYTVTKQVWAEVDGIKQRVTRAKKLTPWYWADGNGISMVVRYGAKPLELSKGKRMLSVANIVALPEVIATLIAAVENGELDAAMETLVGGHKVKPTKG